MITRKQEQCSSQSSQFGFTIIESLIAIVVLAILMTAIAPVITLSVATRVQARRVELATQAAKTYIDGISSGAIPAPNHIISLNEIDSTTKQFSPQRSSFASVDAPTSSGLICTATTVGDHYCQNTPTSSLYCIDLDSQGCSGNSAKDLVVQAFRTTNAQNYILGLRVYRGDAFGDNTALKTQKQTETKQATFTGGLGDRKAPLVEMTTEISTEKTQFRDFCDRLGGCND